MSLSICGFQLLFCDNPAVANRWERRFDAELWFPAKRFQPGIKFGDALAQGGCKWGRPLGLGDSHGGWLMVTSGMQGSERWDGLWIVECGDF
jgi:hypothetical protein